MICPVCSLEGQEITCIAGTKESRIVYHPEKAVRNICRIPGTDGPLQGDQK